MAPLLAHSVNIPPAARSALLAASATKAESRRAHLASAARILYVEAGLDCEDARELVGLGPANDDCGCG